MIYEMKLNERAFYLMKKGIKTVELRLFDAKRQQLNTGDNIIFANVSNKEDMLAVKIRALYRYDGFKDLFSEIAPEKCGSPVGEAIDTAVERMRKYYSEEKVQQYGVLGIKVEIIDLEETLQKKKALDDIELDRFFPDGMK